MYFRPEGALTATAKAPRIDPRAIWAIALPAMVTNVATALIGIGDMWIVGRLGDAPTQGAVDVGARLFAVLFTVMNFLKTGTTGLVAQAGTRDGEAEQAAMLLRGLLVGLTIGALLLLFKPIILPLALDALGAQGEVRGAADTYAEIRYWSAPFVMANFAAIGFLVGQRRMTTVLVIEVAYNLLNVGLGLWFVLGLEWGIAGIGWSSLIAEVAKFGVLAAILLGGASGAALVARLKQGEIARLSQLVPFLKVNRDLFLRTLVLAVALAALTRLSAERGAVALAANGIIYQLFIFTALLLDGFENAAQVLNGERTGARDRAGFTRYIGAILRRGMVVAALVASGLRIGRRPGPRKLCRDRGRGPRGARSGLVAGRHSLRRACRFRFRRRLCRRQLDPGASADHDRCGAGLCHCAMGKLAAGQSRPVVVVHAVPGGARSVSGGAPAPPAPPRIRTLISGSPRPARCLRARPSRNRRSSFPGRRAVSSALPIRSAVRERG